MRISRLTRMIVPSLCVPWQSSLALGQKQLPFSRSETATINNSSLFIASDLKHYRNLEPETWNLRHGNGQTRRAVQAARILVSVERDLRRAERLLGLRAAG